jgi:hypothetical protein
MHPALFFQKVWRQRHSDHFRPLLGLQPLLDTVLVFLMYVLRLQILGHLAKEFLERRLIAQKFQLNIYLYLAN